MRIFTYRRILDKDYPFIFLCGRYPARNERRGYIQVRSPQMQATRLILVRHHSNITK